MACSIFKSFLNKILFYKKDTMESLVREIILSNLDASQKIQVYNRDASYECSK